MVATVYQYRLQSKRNQFPLNGVSCAHLFLNIKEKSQEIFRYYSKSVMGHSTLKRQEHEMVLNQYSLSRELFIWVGIWAHLRVVSVLGEYARAFAY